MRWRAAAGCGATAGGAGSGGTWSLGSGGYSMDAIARHLTDKFRSARAIVAALALAPAQAPAVSDLARRLAELDQSYALRTGPLFYGALGGELNRAQAASEFTRVVASEDFLGRVDALVFESEALLRRAGVAVRTSWSASADGFVSDGEPPRRRRAKTRDGGAPEAAQPVAAELQRLFDVYPYNLIQEQCGATRVNFEQCPHCATTMAVDAGRSLLVCSGCSMLKELVGIVFEDSQFYSQEGQKAKSGTFNPNRHFQFWWTHILAKEPEEEIGDSACPDNQCGEKLVAALRLMVARENSILRLLTVNDVRALLRQMGKTALNKNVSLILKKLTGIGPPVIPDSIAVRVENLFTKAIEIGERVRRSERTNRNYYPYYIYRILEHLLPEHEYEMRRVFYYIYIQSKDTVEADDKDWELICAELEEIEYRPTDRHLGQKYAPR